MTNSFQSCLGAQSKCDDVKMLVHDFLIMQWGIGLTFEIHVNKNLFGVLRHRDLAGRCRGKTGGGNMVWTSDIQTGEEKKHVEIIRCVKLLKKKKLKWTAPFRTDDIAINAKIQASWTRMTKLIPGEGVQGNESTNTNH